MQNFPAAEGSCCERICQTGDDGMSEPLFGHAAFDIGNMVGQLRCEIIHAAESLRQDQRAVLSASLRQW